MDKDIEFNPEAPQRFCVTRFYVIHRRVRVGIFCILVWYNVGNFQPLEVVIQVDSILEIPINSLMLHLFSKLLQEILTDGIKEVLCVQILAGCHAEREDVQC